MAIYSGSWPAGNGDTFDAATIARPNGSQGQVAGRRPPPDPDAPNHAAFTLAARASRDAYLVRLPPAHYDFLLDVEEFPGSTLRRLWDDPQPLEAWCRFNARLFSEYYESPHVELAWPGPSQPYTVQFEVTDANAGDQVATLHITYQVDGEPPSPNGLTIFQIDPRRINSVAAPWFTRLAGLWTWSPGAPHEFDLPLPFMWPMLIGDNYQLMIRVRQNWFWMLTEPAGITVT
jgi:hypothetical protein